MKRQLQEIDSYLPKGALCSIENGKDALEQVNDLLSKIDDMILKRKRVDLALNAEPATKQKILRIFIRHEFMASPDGDRPHFLLFVEGLLLDGSQNGAAPLASFFERISIHTQVEKKNAQGSQTFEWKEDEYPLGSTAHCFRAKIYADKSCAVKILLHRSNEICARYNISDQLRYILPFLRIDASEEEVLLAMWQYLEMDGLIGADKDRRYVRLTEPLKELFYGNKDYPSPSILISSLRGRLLPHMLPARPLLVDHVLNPVNTPELVALSLSNNYSLTGGGRWPTSIAYARVGGRVFEVEADVRDTACFDVLAAINKGTSLEYDANDKIRAHCEKLAYLARRMQAVDQERAEMEAALSQLDAATGATITARSTAEASKSAPDFETPIYERIRHRPATRRIDVPVHSFPHLRSPSAAADASSASSSRAQAADSKDHIHDIKTEPGSTTAAPGTAAGVSGLAATNKPGLLPGKPPLGAAASAKPTSSATATRPDPPTLSYTSLHTLSGFLDVGDDELFSRDKAWLRPACERYVTEQMKLLKTEKP